MRPAIEVYRCASYEDAKLYGSIEGEEAAAIIEADRAEVRLAGERRIVVECTVEEVAGALHIYNPEQLEVTE